MMDKKAFEIQFNWIFVLVAGAAILLFFTLVVVKQKGISEASTKATVLKSIGAIVTGTGVSADTTNIVDIPESSIDVSCGRISLGSVSRQYQNLVLFAPGTLKGDRLVMQTMGFSAPYKAANLLYMTSPQVRYIITGSSRLAGDINKSLPMEMLKEYYKSLPEIKYSNNYKVKFVIFGDMIMLPPSLKNMPDYDVTAIRIVGDDEKGVVEFWQKEGNSWLSKGSSAYLGKASLIGAIYADTKEMYECSMQNVFTRLGIVTRVYAEKTRKLAGSGTGMQCSQFYSSALSHLNGIYAASSSFSKANVDAIAGFAKSLESDNANSRLYSCPFVY